jgi:hypothetical protein
MKVVLASYYRLWMLALFPTTLGVGTLALWWRSSNWPLRIDADGVTLRRHRRLLWNSISRIGVSRSYGDGHVSEMRIHHHGTVSRIPVHGLRDGDEVAAAIITMFKRARGHATGRMTKVMPVADETSLAGPDHFFDQGHVG